MKIPLLAGLLLAGAAQAAEPSTPPAQCLDPNKPLQWEALGDQALVVDSLGRYFLVELEQRCDLLPWSTTVGFVGTGLSRICGRFGEAIRVKGTTCRIAKLTRIERVRYDELLAAKKAKREGSD